MNEEDIAEKAYALVSNQINAWGVDNDEDMYDDDLDFDDEDEDDFDDKYNDDGNEQEYGMDYVKNDNNELHMGNDRNSLDNQSYVSPDRSDLLRRRSSSGAYSRDGSIKSYDGSLDTHDTSSPFKFTIFHSLSSSDNNASKNNGTFLEYYDTLSTFLSRKKSLATKIDIANLNIQEEDDDDMQMDIEQRFEQDRSSIDLDYLHSLSKLCQMRVSDHSSAPVATSMNVLSYTRQMQLWLLLHLLCRHDSTKNSNETSFLLPSSTNHQEKASSFIAADIYSTPPQILQKLLQSNFYFQRRYLLLQWISSSLLTNYHRPIYLPPKSRNTMWPVSLRSSSNYEMDPDAPLRNIMQNQNGIALPGTDESDEVDFLKALLRLYQSNQISKALQLCDEVGQPWRASTFLGGLLTHHLQEDDEQVKKRDENWEESDEDDEQEDTDENNKSHLISKWNPNYFLWKQQCAQLAQKTLALSQESRNKEPSSLVYESALYSILSGDLSSAITNPLLRTWEDSVFVQFHSLVHRMMDEALVQHCNLQRE